MSSERLYVWVHRVFTALSVVVFASGVALFLWYRPTAAQAWNDVFQLGDEIRFGTVARSVHRWVTLLWLGLLVPLAGVELVRRSWLTGAVFAVTLLLTVATTFTGYLLPWDQLALWAVEPGAGVSGYRQILFGDDVRFVLVDGVEIGLSTIRRWFYGHVGLGVAVLLLARLGYRPAGEERTRSEDEAASE